GGGPRPGPGAAGRLVCRRWREQAWRRLLSGVIGTAANVGVAGRARRGRGGVGQGDPVGAARQDVLHGAVAGRAEVQGPRTGGVHARGAVGLAQAHEAQTRAIALLGMRLARQQRGDERGGGGARRLRPADEARGRPLGVRPMRGVSNSRTAAFSSARLKKRRWRSTAKIQRCATSTFASTTALSRGWPPRAGTTAAP